MSIEFAYQVLPLLHNCLWSDLSIKLTNSHDSDLSPESDYNMTIITVLSPFSKTKEIHKITKKFQNGWKNMSFLMKDVVILSHSFAKQ